MRYTSIFILIGAVLMGIVMPKAGLCQDNVSELEKKVQALESQLNEMKAALDELKQEKAAVPAVAAPAEGQMQLVGPGGTLRVGGDIRLRGLFFDNVWNYDNANDTDQREVFRFRPRVFFDWKPTDDMEAYVRMTKEWFYGQDEEMPGYDVEGKDVAFDSAWFEVKNMLNTGFTLKAGRQDLIYGEGLVLLDGTPYDGSQTIGFDAIKLTYPHEWGTTDVIYSKLHENNADLADDEDLYGIYNKLKFGNTGVEPYLLYRNKNLDADKGVNLVRGINALDPVLRGPTGEVLTDDAVSPYTFGEQLDPSPGEETILLGARLTHMFELNDDGMTLSLGAEGGKEWGTVDFTGSGNLPGAFQFNRFAGDNRVDRDAWAGYLHGTLAFNNAPWKPSFKAAVSYFSGDDPDSSDYEGWDDFYGQWPKYSELYVYSLYDGFKSRTGANDPDVGVWSNMIIPEAMITVKPTEKYTQSLRYLYYLADEKNSLVNNGDERGHNLQWLSQYVFNNNLSGHFLAEWFAPGDFYADDADDAFFVRFELMYKF